LLPHVSFTLLEETSQCPQEDIMAHIGHEMGWVLHLFNEEPNVQRLRFASIDSFNKFMKIIDSMRWCFHRHPSNTIFPEAPIPGNAWLSPITTLLELIQEGTGQHNCIASVADEVIKGRMYVYRVLSPWRRSTLLIRLEPSNGGRWSIVNCRASCNAVVEAALLQHIHHWLEAGEAARNPNSVVEHSGQLLFCGMG
jgi:hypothetical protein